MGTQFLNFFYNEMAFRLISRQICKRKTLRVNRFASAATTSLPENLLNIPRLRETKLNNGFRIASEDSGGETASVGIFIDAGSAFETNETNGTAHFLEHISFKGTSKRSRTDIELEVENMGAHLNAYTSREQTVYYAQCLKNDVPQVVDILSDIVQNSQLAPEHIENERSVILQEKETVESDPEEVLFDYLHAAAYQGTPLARTILGPERNIKSIGAADLKAYIDAHYKPPRMALCAAGGVEHSALVGAAEAAFGKLEAGGSAPERSVPAFTGSEIRLRDDAMPRAHIAVGFESVGWSSPDYYVFQVLQSLVGSWNRSSPASVNSVSRLAELVATEDLADSFSAFHTAYNKTGLFGIHFVSQNERTDDMVCESLQELVRLAYDSTPTEIERAKNAVKAQQLLSLDGSTPVVEEIGRQLIAIGRRVPPAETWARIDAITPDDVQRVAKHFLTDVDIAVSAIGPLGNLPEYNQLRSWTYQLRF